MKYYIRDRKCLGNMSIYFLGFNWKKCLVGWQYFLYYFITKGSDDLSKVLMEQSLLGIKNVFYVLL